jgi:transposase
LELLDRLTPTISELTQQIEREVEKYPAAQRLMTHPGVGALTALAYVLIIGEAARFESSKQISAYLGPGSGGRLQWGKASAGTISKQGSGLMRFFLVEAAQVMVRSDPEWRAKFFHLALRRGR